MEDVTGEVIITLSSVEKKYSYDRLGVTYESSDEEILNALTPILLEEEGFDIDDSSETFTIKKVGASRNTYVFPKSTAGAL